MRFIKPLYKFTILAGAAISISALGVSSALAENSNVFVTNMGTVETYLSQIAQYTYGTLQNVNNLPSYLAQINTAVQSWLSQDNTSNTATLQGLFTSLGNSYGQAQGQDDNPQSNLPLLAILFGAPDKPLSISDFGSTNPAILRTIPNINELSFTTLLGSPPAPKAPNVSNAVNKYIANAAGFSILHPTPDAGWQGAKEDIDRYKAYYNTVMAVESYNGYILQNTRLNASNNKAGTSQSQLIQLATSPEWFAQIASEDPGIVLRQLLLFESQVYVLLTQFIQGQEQQQLSQAMTNALLIANNQQFESIMLARAQGVPLTQAQ